MLIHPKVYSILMLIVWNLFHFSCFGQNGYNILNTDTLEIRGDSVLVILKSFEDSVLKEEVSAFLVPDSLYSVKYPRLFKSRFGKWSPATKIIRHGKSIEYLGEVLKKNERQEVVKNLGEVQCISIYHLDKLIIKYYINSKEENISLEDIEYKNIRGPCGISSGTYFIEGKKKSK